MGENAVTPTQEVKAPLDLLLSPGDAFRVRQQQVIAFKKYPAILNVLTDMAEEGPADVGIGKVQLAAIKEFLSHLQLICGGVAEKMGRSPIENLSEILAEMAPEERKRIRLQIEAALNFRVEQMDLRMIQYLKPRILAREMELLASS